MFTHALRLAAAGFFATVLTTSVACNSSGTTEHTEVLLVRADQPCPTAEEVQAYLGADDEVTVQRFVTTALAHDPQTVCWYRESTYSPVTCVDEMPAYDGTERHNFRVSRDSQLRYASRTTFMEASTNASHTFEGSSCDAEGALRAEPVLMPMTTISEAVAARAVECPHALSAADPRNGPAAPGTLVGKDLYPARAACFYKTLRPACTHNGVIGGGGGWCISDMTIEDIRGGA